MTHPRDIKSVRGDAGKTLRSRKSQELLEALLRVLLSFPDPRINPASANEGVVNEAGTIAGAKTFSRWGHF